MGSPYPLMPQPDDEPKPVMPSGYGYGQMLDTSKLVNPAWAAADARGLRAVPMGSTPGWPIGADAQGSMSLLGGPQPTPVPVAQAGAVSAPPTVRPPQPTGGDGSSFSFNPDMKMNLGLAPAQQETVPSGTRLTTTIDGGHGLSATQFNDRPGLSGQAWLDDQRADPRNAWHDESMGKWTGSSDEGGFSPERVYGDIGEHDPVPNDPADYGGSREGYLFSGGGTQADDEGRLRLGQFRNMIAAQEREAADPFAEQRLKGEYDVQKAVAPALINAQGDMRVAKLQSDTQQAIEGMRGLNAVTKEEAQYASYDQLVISKAQEDIQQMLQLAQIHKKAPEQVEAARQNIINDAIQKRLKIREIGVGGQQNPLAAFIAQNNQVSQVPPQPNQR